MVGTAATVRCLLWEARGERRARSRPSPTMGWPGRSLGGRHHSGASHAVPRDANLPGALASLGEVVPALIETVAGMAEWLTIARSGYAAHLAFGSVDYAADLCCDHVPEALVAVRAEIVLTSRLGGLPTPLDGVTTDLCDPAIAESDARDARTHRIRRQARDPSAPDRADQEGLPAPAERDRMGETSAGQWRWRGSHRPVDDRRAGSGSCTRPAGARVQP